MAALPGLVAHGGVAGAIIELLLVLTIAALFFAVWLRERRSPPDEDQSDEDQSKPQ